ncbi:MAG: NAD(+) synthase [Peptococcaceae bacterium]|nr:MAG: NAD(+) synthase [Peptococcaceae bacterium]
MQEKINNLTRWLGVQVAEAKAEGLVVGLSGGIDSAVTIALCKRVCPDSTIGVIMPCHSDPRDAKDAQLVADFFGVSVEVVVLDDVFDLLLRRLTGETCEPTVKDLSIANIKPRLRMTTLYFFAARRKSLVVGTGNKSELTVGYFTKYGDGGVDLLPIGNLVKTEVREMARCLGVPQRIIDKSPSAGLWLGHDDEVEMGVTYEELDRCIMTGECSLEAKKIIEELAKRSEHKKIMPLLPQF